jgi:spermidine/putrescine transport system permease protein
MNRLRALCLAPAALWLLALFGLPMVIVASYSLLTRGPYGGVSLPWTAESYARLADPLYLMILLRSFLMAGVSTAICLAMGYPLAVFISQSGKRKNLYLSLVIIPFWTSFLVRTYAWMFLLRDTGLINSTLQALGVTHEPLPLLYNNGAVILGLVYGYLPFMVLPLFAAIERLDPSLLEAAADLGARPWTAFTRVMLPLSVSGIRAGCVLVFISCLGSYLTPDLLGGGKSIMIGNLVQNQFQNARDWPFGAAVSLVVMAITMLLLMRFARSGEDQLL